MRRKPLPNALDIDLRGGLTERVTPHAGVALLIDAMRRAGVPAAAERHLPAKRSPKGLAQGQMVETLVLLSALGGECLDDLDHLRRDRGLAALTGYDLPAASTARQWLDRFHEPELLAARPAQGSFIPMESAGLAGLRAVLVTAIRSFVTAVPVGDAVTLDVDAHLVESSKSTALPTYEGFRGFQPALVSWAETGLVLADQFRDGNVPASVRPRRPRRRGLCRAVRRRVEGQRALRLGRLRGRPARPLGGARLAFRGERRHEPAAARRGRRPAHRGLGRPRGLSAFK